MGAGSPSSAVRRQGGRYLAYDSRHRDCFGTSRLLVGSTGARAGAGCRHGCSQRGGSDVHTRRTAATDDSRPRVSPDQEARACRPSCHTGWRVQEAGRPQRRQGDRAVDRQHGQSRRTPDHGARCRSDRSRLATGAPPDATERIDRLDSRGQHDREHRSHAHRDLAQASYAHGLPQGGRIKQLGVALGAPSTPTPKGTFAVYQKVREPGYSPLGPWALHLTAHSNVLFEYAGGPGRVAIHGARGALWATAGTNPSHGCIRVPDPKIATLVPLVRPGTPVEIVA